MITGAIIQFILRNWKGIALTGAILFALSLSFDKGREYGEAKMSGLIAERDRVASEAMSQAMETAKANAKAAFDAERKLIEDRAKLEGQFKIITQTVTKYVDKTPDRRECDADTEFVRLWNSANRGRSTGSDLSP